MMQPPPIPERPIEPPSHFRKATQHSGMGIAGFIIGIVAILFCAWMAWHAAPSLIYEDPYYGDYGYNQSRIDDGIAAVFLGIVAFVFAVVGIALSGAGATNKLRKTGIAKGGVVLNGLVIVGLIGFVVALAIYNS